MQLTESQRVQIANYDQYGDPVYDSIRRVPPAAFKGAALAVRYGGGPDDAANFCGVFSFGQLLAALPPKGD